jgi:hypothetical protein
MLGSSLRRKFAICASIMAPELPTPWRHKILILHGRVKTEISSNFDRNLALFHVGYCIVGEVPDLDRPGPSCFFHRRPAVLVNTREMFHTVLV